MAATLTMVEAVEGVTLVMALLSPSFLPLSVPAHEPLLTGDNGSRQAEVELLCHQVVLAGRVAGNSL